MMGIRTAAALVSAVNAGWLLVVGTFWSDLTGVRCLADGCGNEPAIQALGVVVLAVSLVCFLGFAKAFYGSAGLSALAIVVFAFYSGKLEDLAFAVTIVLGIAAVAVDVVAASRKPVVDEQNHPLNLPVFG